MLPLFKSVYSSMQLDSIDQIDLIYSNKVEFRDPFHKVSGLNNLRRYFFEMYQNLIAIEFEFGEEAINNNKAFVQWQMHLSHRRLNRGKPFTVEGSTLLKFDDDGKIYFHQDFFDGAALIYQQLPLVGPVIRWIRSKV